MFKLIVEIKLGQDIFMSRHKSNKLTKTGFKVFEMWKQVQILLLF